jgi:hypothetical protein
MITNYLNGSFKNQRINRKGRKVFRKERKENLFEPILCELYVTFAFFAVKSFPEFLEVS